MCRDPIGEDFTAVIMRKGVGVQGNDPNRSQRDIFAPNMSPDPVSLGISVASFGLSATVAWLTLLHPGTMKLVRPSLIAFLARGNDGPKVWFRGLLYNTSRRGAVLESLFVRLRRGETQQNFSFWVCGSDRTKLGSGCGLYVGREGVALDHHFVLPKDGSTFEFLSGDYVLEVFATVVSAKAPQCLARVHLALTDEHATSLKNPEQSVYFDWWPDSARYNAHVPRTL